MNIHISSSPVQKATILSIAMQLTLPVQGCLIPITERVQLDDSHATLLAAALDIKHAACSHSAVCPQVHGGVRAAGDPGQSRLAAAASGHPLPATSAAQVSFTCTDLFCWLMESCMKSCMVASPVHTRMHNIDG